MKKLWATCSIVLLILTASVACTPPTERPAEELTSKTDESAQEALTIVTDTPLTESKELATDNVDDDADLSRTDMDTAVLIYERRGGTKGIGPNVLEWRFYGDGRIVGSDGASWQVEPDEVANLVAEIAASGFNSLENDYIPEDTCCDRTTHVITMHTAGEKHTIETLDEAEMPQALEENIQIINSFLMALYE